MSVLTKVFVFIQILLVINLIGLTLVFGCGQFPQGRVHAMSFTASGFTLSPEMVYSEDSKVQLAISSISHSKDAAIRIIRDLIMNAVNNVLEEQGRNALLPDSVIQLILQQLNVTIDYTPLNCPTATVDRMNAAPTMADVDGCFIIEDVVVILCAKKTDCKVSDGMHLKAFPPEHRIIKGSLETSNIIMANWSRQMWQSILNRVYQKIISGRFKKYFTTAVVAVSN